MFDPFLFVGIKGPIGLKSNNIYIMKNHNQAPWFDSQS
jgi:hypothetical protein